MKNAATFEFVNNIYQSSKQLKLCAVLAKNGKAPKANGKFVEGIGKLGIGTVLSPTHWMV